MKNNKGITIVALIVTIGLITILAGLTVGTGKRIIKSSELENIKTNMLLIEVKGKEYVENANFNLGKIETVTDENEKAKRVENAKSQINKINDVTIEEITDASIFPESLNITDIAGDNSNYIYYYKLTTQNLANMGINKVKSNQKDGWYIVKYDIKNIKVEIYNTKGYETENGTVYSLSEIKEMQN